jgi:putative spermidine/putrescine transport system substrate-binding protein
MFVTAKKLWSLALVLMMVFSVSACGGDEKPAEPSGSTEGAAQTLVVATWGGASETGLREIVGPFEEANNVEVLFDIGNNSDRLSKLQANKSNPVVDVALFSDTFSELGNAEGLFAPVSAEEVPNIAELYPFAVHKDGFGPGYSVVRYGIIYNTETVPEPPVSYQELFTRDDLKFGLPDMSTTPGLLLFSLLADELGSEDAAQAFYAENKERIVYIYTAADIQTAFERGEVDVTVYMDIMLSVWQGAGLPVAWSDAAEGNLGVVNTVNVVSGTPHLELAMKFVDYMLSVDVQQQIGVLLTEAPANKNAVLSEDIAAKVAYGEEAVAQIRTFDNNQINAVKAEWVEWFQREIAAAE